MRFAQVVFFGSHLSQVGRINAALAPTDMIQLFALLNIANK
jgi:hypothetical protein